MMKKPFEQVRQADKDASNEKVSPLQNAFQTARQTDRPTDGRTYPLIEMLDASNSS